MRISSECRLRWLAGAVCWSALLLASLCGAASRNRCLKKMSSRNLAPGEEFRETRVSLNCDRGDIKWLGARKTHILTFTKGNQDLVVCLTVERPGARVYRLKGTQRLLIAGENHTGFVDCYESECKHVSFRFQVSDDYSGPTNLLYSYSGYIDIKCPECSETCQTDCLCSSEFAFHGKLVRSVYRTNTHLNYFQVAEFVRYNGEYRKPTLVHHTSDCPIVSSNLNSENGTELVEMPGPTLEERIAAEIPVSGTVRVIAKCPLKPNKTYFVSARLHIAPSGRPRLIMCCQHSDEHFAEAHLEHLILRQECCRHVRSP